MQDRSGNPNSYAAILWRRRMPIAIVLAVGLGITFAMLNRPHYQATSTVMQVGVGDQNARADTASTDLPTLLLSSSVAGTVRRQMHIDESPDDFIASITPKTVPGSTVLAITYQDSDRVRAVDTANALAERMSAYYREIAFQRLDALDGYLKGKLREQERDIADIDSRLSESVVAHPDAAGKDIVNAAANRVASLQAQRDEYDVKVRGDDAYVASEEQRIANLSSTFHYEMEQADPLLRELQQHVALDTASAAPLLAGYRPDYPGVQSLTSQLARERKLVSSRQADLKNVPVGASGTFRRAEISLSNAKATAADDRAQLQTLDAQIGEARESMRVLPKLNYSIDALETRRTADVSAYEALATRRSTVIADQAENASVGSVVVVDRAVTADASLIGGHSVRLAGGLVSVVFLAIGLAFVLEALDTRLRDGGAIERTYGRPYLGEVS
jgi:uncharacterized protein involved in exopolysaccharide biosynthesis